MSPTTESSTTSRNGSIPHPVRGAALAMWELFDSAKSPVNAEQLPKLAEKKEWNLGTLKFHFREWLVYTGKLPARTGEVQANGARRAGEGKKTSAKKAAPAKTVAAKKAVPAKKAAAKKAVTKNVAKQAKQAKAA